MKILLITEKSSPNNNQRDGGAILVDTIKRAFGDSLSVMQFGFQTDFSATWRFDYPFELNNRFEKRLANAKFIAEKIKDVEQSFTHIIFIHVSMQFGLVDLPLREGIHIWTFPMFLTPSYKVSGENVPESYFERERLTLANSKNIVTPSHLERRQLIELYAIPEERIHVIPRGVNNKFLFPKIRSLNGPPNFCNIGSIKPQKDTLGLIRLFANMHDKFPGSILKIIGPIQSFEYYEKVQTEIQHLGVDENVQLVGHVPPNNLALVIKDAHIHLSTSKCETFGRSIFETLASGLPNIARITANAAADFLNNLPYVRFVIDDNEAVKVAEEMLADLSKLSSMALEIGRLYDDEILSRLLVAKICNKDVMAISDFDGTLFHKDDSEKTQRCIKAFQSFPVRVICSARPIHELIDRLRNYNLTVDWIVAYSGAIVATGCGKLLWLTSLDLNAVTQLEESVPQSRRIEFGGKILQMEVPFESMPNDLILRREVYQKIAFLSNWQASKLRAVHRLLCYTNWSGQIRAFGDGPYDIELLTYFDGTLITSSPHDKCQKKEIENV